MIVVLVFILIYRDDDIDPMPDFSSGLFREEKVNIVPKKWRNMEKIALDSPAATNLVKRLIQGKGSILTLLQKTLLEETLTAWFYKRKTGSYRRLHGFLRARLLEYESR